MKACYRYRGAISVFLVLILLPVVVFGGLITDAARIYHSRGLVSEAGELAMNAALSHYDGELKNDYGLLLMNQTPEEMEADLEQYFINTLRASGLPGSEDVSTLLDLKCPSFHSYGVTGSEIYQTEVEKQQILEYMKYRAPICIGEELIEKMNGIKSQKKKVEAVNAQVEYAESMDDLNDVGEKVFNELKKYVNEAEQGAPITTDAVNGAVNDILSSLREAVRCYFVTYMINHYFQGNGAYDPYGDAVYYMQDYVNKASVLENCTEGNAVEYIDACMRALYAFKSADKAIEKLPDNTIVVPEEELPAIDALIEEYDKKLNVVTADYWNKLNNYASNKIEYAKGIYRTWTGKISNAKKAANNACQKLPNLKNEISKTSGKYNNWKQKVDALPDGDEMKKAMKDGTDKAPKGLTEAAVNELERKLNENSNLLGSMEAAFNGITIFGKKFNSNYNRQSAINYIQSYGFWPNSQVALRAWEEAEKNVVLTVNLPMAKLHSIKEDQLYKDLQENCERDEDKQAGNVAESKTNDWLKKAEMSVTGDGIHTLEDINWNAKTLPSVKLSQSYGEGSNNGNYVLSGGGTDKNGRKEAMEDTKESLGQMSSFLDTLSEILEAALENIYITEYGMQMFSYYTVDKDANGNALSADKIRSLSNDDLREHAMYKAEVEYMLWGQKNVQKNVQNTRLLLYGIRFLFNIFYTFTDSTVSKCVKPLALAMSCGAAFLVPVFEVVIKLALAGAETALDVTDLMSGKAVPIIKKASNSQISLQGVVGGGNQQKNDITLNYKEYLTIFLLIKTFGPLETKTLARIADCIQLNTELDITDRCFTMVSIDAKVEARTTFMGMAARLPDSKKNSAYQDRFSIPYQSVLGY